MVLESIGTMVAIKGLEAFAAELGKRVVSDFLSPALKKSVLFTDREYEVESCIEKYLKRVYEKSVRMNTIVFRGIEKYLWDLYIPLTLIPDDQTKERYVINDECLNSIRDQNKMLIVDTAGMGKSTIVKFLIMQILVENEKIPILVELRRVKENIMDYLLKEFESFEYKLDKEELIEMLSNGNFIIFFDGYDEVGNERKGDVLEQIQEFILKANGNQFIITSREETDLSALADFTRFSIKPLSAGEAFELIKLYDGGGELSEKLINRIKNDEQLKMLSEFLNNAMLTSLLYKTFQYKEEIAYKKLDFYSQVYEALFNDHDKTKGGAYVHEKLCLLDSTDFERLLRYIAFFSLQADIVEYENKSHLISIIQTAIDSMSWIDASAEKVLNDLTHSVPFLQRDGVSYKWVHKSFMEYFAAGFICYESQKVEKLFTQMVTSPNIDSYMNVLDFCFEIKPEIARKVIVLPFLDKYIKYHDSVYLNSGFQSYDQDIIESMKFLTFISDFKIFLFESPEIAENIFEEKETKSRLFSDLEKKRINVISYKGNSRTIIATLFKQEKKVYELLRIKNIDIFERAKVNHNRNNNKELDYKDNEQGKFEVSIMVS